MKHRHLVVLMTVTLAALGSVRAALADAAPPPPPPAGSVENGEYPTMVQMESETVIMTIADDIAYVKATFNMRNQGTKDEAFDVRFPVDSEAEVYSEASGNAEIVTVHNFAAYVDGNPAEVTYAEYTDNPSYHWATWHVTFPAGLPVTLGVIYQVDPYMSTTGNYQEYTYILHTGAGWFGPIGKGTITIRLPYEVSEFNTYMPESTLPDHTISGTDIIWQFTNYEPTEYDDIAVVTMSPQAWRAIQSAQQAVEGDPGSANAHFKLARALSNGLSSQTKPCFVTIGDSGKQMLARAEAEFQQALEIAPHSIEIYNDYIGFLWQLDFCGDDRRDQIREAVQRAWKIEPGNEELLTLLEEYRIEEYLTPIPTRSHAYTPSSTQASEPTLTQSIASPTLTLTVPTPLTPTSISAPAASSATPPLTLWAAIGAAVIGGAGVGVWAYRRNRSIRE